jgi:hypothetical protein
MLCYVATENNSVYANRRGLLSFPTSSGNSPSEQRCGSFVRTYLRLFSVVFLFVLSLPPCSLAQERTTPPPVQFAPPITYGYPGSYPQVIASGEFTSDGIQDLIVGAYYGDIGLKLGRGDGTFRRWINANSPSGSASALAVGKFDGKNLDIVVNDYDDAWVLLGGGGGGFPHYTFLDAGDNFVAGFAVGDFNGDGMQDIAALVDIPGQNSDSSEIYLFLGNGDGTFQSPRQFPASGLGPVAILAGDFNGDGKLDLAVLSSFLHDGIGRVSVLLGSGTGGFGHPIAFPLHGLSFSADPLAMSMGDFDGDHELDLALAYVNIGASPASIRILLGNGDGTFRKGTRIRMGQFSASIATADFNGDGTPDLVVPGIHCPIEGHHPNCISVLLGNGDGTFQLPVGFREGTGAAQLTVADFNGDGKPDVACVNGATVSVLLNTTPFPAAKGKRVRGQRH